jgi:DNA-binding PadR family transcriptional regulator
MHKRHHRNFLYVSGPGGPGGPELGEPGGMGGPFGPGPFGRGGPRHLRRRRMRRGDVRAAILVLLAEQPRNGYQLMQEIEERSGGTWRPSPGSVYPALQLLADEGLVRSESKDGANEFQLTDGGKAHVEENREQLGEPWAQAEAGVPGGERELMGLAMQVGIAAKQVTHAGTEAQVKTATEILTETRRSLYRILAEE